MPYELRHADGLLALRFVGTLTNLDLLRLIDEVTAVEAACTAIPDRLVDLRPVERLEIDFKGVFAVAEARRRMTFPNSFRTALVASDLVQFGFARMFQTLNDHPQITVAIFEDEEGARQWLRGAEPQGRQAGGGRR